MSEGTQNHFKVSRYERKDGFHDILFEVDEVVGNFPESVVNLKNDIENVVKISMLLFKDDAQSYEGYYERLYMVADLAFNGSKEQISLAQDTLNNIKVDLVHEIGPRIRTTLLFKYIRVSFIPILLMLLVSLGLYYFESKSLYVVKLILISIGANIGCWLSLAVRTRSVEFDQILPILSDHKGVHSRIIFVMVFSVVMAILMKTGLLSIELGEFSSKSIVSDNYSALSAGFILGFAEKLFVDKFQGKINSIKV
ncbi:hypothetical protein DSB67_00725 [Vibrio campbellii]|uniref:hypothetical protein n=1 Tax=Vibrio campbellii TaxID=680 RepID=UPI00026C4BFB|nr:hypothetical protein [Vibrio campbellii]AXB30200.1 hypothetical protein DSB67_00725 [Vibrio campbellii]